MKLAIEAFEAMGHETSIGPMSPLENGQGRSAQYVIGADIGATSLRLALADSAGVILGRWSASTSGTRDAGAVVRLIRTGVDALLREAALPADALSAIAAGAPGITNTEIGVVIATSYLMGWRDVPLREMLETEFGVPASVDNDVNAAAIGEQAFGAAHGAADFVFLAIGTGIGAGIVLNGQVHRGSIWTAGEIGYMLVPGTSETPVEPGQPGALEAVAGGEGIKAQWKAGWNASLTTLPQDAAPTQIFDHAQQGNPLAKEVLQRAAKTLAYAIYNTSLILNSPLFVLGGSVGLHPALAEATRLVLKQRRTRMEPEVICSALGADAQLLGAIYLALATASRATGLAEG